MFPQLICHFGRISWRFSISPFAPFSVLAFFCARRVLGLSVAWNMGLSSVPMSMGLSVPSFHVNLSVEQFVYFNMFF